MSVLRLAVDIIINPSYLSLNYINISVLGIKVRVELKLRLLIKLLVKSLLIPPPPKLKKKVY